MNELKPHRVYGGTTCGERAAVGRRLALALGLLAGLVVVCVPAEAGSIFMKNGYIIQGAIVDRDDTSFIMGWPNGKVTIARRFVETVVFDPAEEQSLRELEAARRESETGAPTDFQLSMLSEPTETPELPSTLEGFMKAYDVGPLELRRPNATSVATQEGDGQAEKPPAGIPDVVQDPTPVEPPPETTPQVDVQKLGPDGERLGNRIYSSRWAFSVRPPAGWTDESTETFFQVAGEADAAGFRPSMNVIVFPRGVLEKDDCVRLLKDEQGSLLIPLTTLEEDWRELSGEEAYQVVASGSYQGRAAVLRQCLLVRDQEVWLISSFTADNEMSGDFGTSEEALKTFEFGAD